VYAVVRGFKLTGKRQAVFTCCTHENNEMSCTCCMHEGNDSDCYLSGRRLAVSHVYQYNREWVCSQTASDFTIKAIKLVIKVFHVSNLSFQLPGL